MLALSFGVEAQSKRFVSLSTNEGLPQNSVECFTQDSAGFLWIGTQDGLARYDGYKMLVFRNDPNDRTSLSDNFITALHIDRDGDLWVGTRNGLNLYDPVRNGFYKFWPDSTALHQQSLVIRNDPGGHVLAGLGPFLYGFDKSKVNRWKNEIADCPAASLAHEGGARDKRILSSGQTLVLTDSGLVVSAGAADQRFDLKDSWPGVKLGASEIIPTDDGALILNGGLYHFNASGPAVTPITIPELDGVAHLVSLTLIEDELWLCTESGVYILDALDPERIKAHYTHDPNDPFSISYDFVHRAFQDREGRVWLGTANQGLNVHDPKWNHLHYITHRPDETGLPNPLVWSSCFVNGSDLWIGTGQGIAVVQGFQPKQQRMRISLTEQLAIIESVRDILETEDGVVWIASGRNGLFSYDPRMAAMTSWNEHHELANEMVSLAQDDLGRVWIASYSGLYRLSADRNELVRLDEDWGISSYIMSVSATEKGMLVCHSKGLDLVRWTDGQESRTSFGYDPTTDGNLPFSITSSAAQLGDETWIGMYDRGVAITDASGKVIQVLGESEGLAGHVVEAVVRDQKDRIWVATNQGLSCIDPETHAVHNITVRSGLRSQEFALDAGMMDERGWLYFGTVDGLLYFHPDSVLPSTAATLHPVRLSTLSINYKDYRNSQAEFAGKTLAALSSMELNPTDKVVSFEFSALQFAKAEELIYRYRMTGFDPDWVQTTSDQRIATYSSLPAGEYDFEVEAMHADGTPAALSLSLAVVVLPPFYETWWFRLGAVALVLLSVTGTVRYVAYRKYRRQLREMQTRERIQRERQRISRDLHDNVGSQITYMISSLDNLAYQTSKTEQDQASGQINDLSDFARGTMQQLREAIWVINKDEVSLEEFRLKLEEYCHKLLGAHEALEWKVVLNGNSGRVLQPGAVLHLFRICQEAINNVMKHAQASEIQITISEENGKVHLRLKDDGIGFDAQRRKTGHYGLDNMAERAKQMGGRIDWKSTKGQGTVVEVEL